MTILKELRKEEVWINFLNGKTERNQLSKKEIKELTVFIEQKRYLNITDTFSFDYPTKRIVTKTGSAKKRIIYSYSPDETWALKLLAHLLYKYDDTISPNCYSFRKNITAKTAFDRILEIDDLDNKYVLKTDIHDYFNSINVDILMTMLSEVIKDDSQLLDFLGNLLKQNKCYYYDNKLIEENRGAMAGVPLASFFANIYLSLLDKKFLEKNIPYFRYSDDILVFNDSSEQLEENFSLIKSHIEDLGLTLNMDKFSISPPHDKWEFLGFSYKHGTIDLSETTIKKMNDKIRRKAHQLYRKKIRNNYTYEKTARSMIRSFDYKFYDLSGNNPFTWTRFYFPVITVSDGLHQIDEAMIRYLRYLYSGRHYKGNYKVTYDTLKKLGYTSLVNEYYTWKKDNNTLLNQ